MKVIILNKDIFPPEADMTYESFFESAKHDTASSGFVSLKSFVITVPLGGCHKCGAMLAVACKDRKGYLIRFRSGLPLGVGVGNEYLATIIFLPFPQLVYSIGC